MVGSKRGFSLIEPPKPLVDDDVPPQSATVPTSRASAARSAAARVPTPVADADEPPEPGVDVRETPVAKPRRPEVSKAAPGTIRLNEAAGSALWAAYLDAKAQDHFLSYRQFASNVVLEGITRKTR